MISQKLVNELSRQLSGYVLQPGDVGYLAATQIDNGRVQRRPGIIVFPIVVNDVVVALQWAHKNQILLTAKGGGHGAAGYCLNHDGVVLDLSYMNAIRFDPAKSSVTVQTGARWREVYQYMEATKTGLIPVGGGCPTVGIPGFMLGGGYSFVSRSYGMSIDNLLSITLITANGSLRTVGEHSTSVADKDLFWACRGGGGGNFGVVVEMEMRVQKPRSERMLTGQFRFPIERAEEVIAFYNEWVESLPDEMAVYGYWGPYADPVHPQEPIKTVGLTPVYNGSFMAGVDLLQGVLKLSPISAGLYDMTLPQWETYNGSVTMVANRSAYMRSVVLEKHGMTAPVAKIFVKHMQTAPSPNSFAVWTHAGGAISRKSVDETAFVHRSARFIPEVKAIWDADKPGETKRNVEWAYDFFEDLRAHASGAYLNYIDPLLSEWSAMYYGEHYARLVTIKKSVDPDSMFRFQQSVGSSFDPSGSRPLDLSPLNRTI